MCWLIEICGTIHYRGVVALSLAEKYNTMYGKGFIEAKVVEKKLQLCYRFEVWTFSFSP